MSKRHRKSQLYKENRWVVIANAFDWDCIDEEYGKSFIKDETAYNAAYDLMGALGTLCIQKKPDLTDAETVEMIQENPISIISSTTITNICIISFKSSRK